MAAICAALLQPALFCNAGTCESRLSSSSSYVTGGQLFSRRCTVSTAANKRGNVTVVKAQLDENRPLWFPGSPAPAHLDGSLAGDFGFDPLSLGAEKEDLRWYVQAELVHARFAMAGVAGILLTDILRVTGLRDLPVWYKAGAAHYDLADAWTLFAVQILLFAFVETKRYMDFRKPGSQKDEEIAWFFGIEPAFEGLENGYPGGPVFDPMGFAANTKTIQEMKQREIKNGRLAMIAAVGFAVQAAVTKQGPFENLLTHLANPFHATIFQSLGISP
eukprot:jgi/Mesen1/5608/ME000282S04758